MTEETGYALAGGENESSEKLCCLVEILTAITEDRLIMLAAPIGSCIYVLEQKKSCVTCRRHTDLCGADCENKSMTSCVRKARLYGVSVLEGETEGDLWMRYHASVFADADAHGHTINFREEDIGKHVFLTCAGAEQAMKEQSNGGQ